MIAYNTYNKISNLTLSIVNFAFISLETPSSAVRLDADFTRTSLASINE